MAYIERIVNADGTVTERTMTAAEAAAFDAAKVEAAATAAADAAAESNRATLTEQAVAAFNTNRAAITRNTASIAVANPTNTQVVAAVKDALGQLSQLEAQNNAIMRLVLGLLDGTN